MARQVEPEGSAAAVAVLEAYMAVHHLDQALANGEPEAGAAFLARRGGIGLAEAAEHARAEGLRNSPAPVVHCNAQAPRRRLGAGLDHLALGRKLRRVGEQVGHDLQQAFVVAGDLLGAKLAARLEAHLEAVAEALV